MTCSLDRNGQRSLMSGAVAGDAARKNLSSLGNIFLQCSDILIVNRLRILRAEHTDFSSSAHPARSSASLAIGSFTLGKSHDLVPLQSV